MILFSHARHIFSVVFGADSLKKTTEKHLTAHKHRQPLAGEHGTFIGLKVRYFSKYPKRSIYTLNLHNTELTHRDIHV